MALASCLMPTAGRGDFVVQAIDLFLAQDYPDKELIVLDNGAEPVADRIPADPRIFYHRQEPGPRLGQLRNQACALAHGDILLNWDDDDWYAPWRVRYQLEALIASNAEVCGIDRVHFMDAERRLAWQYVYPADRPRWVCGATLCFTRQRWLRHPFPGLQIGEDTRFVRQTEAERITVLPNNDFFIGRVHRRNTAAKQTQPPYWQAQPFDRVMRLKQAVAPTSAPPAPDALVCAGGGIGDILRLTPIITVLRQSGYCVDVLLAPDYPAAADLLRPAKDIRTVALARPHGKADELAGRDYALSVTNTFGRAAARYYRAGRCLSFDPKQWYAQGDTACVETIAASLGWEQKLPPPFAVASARRFDLPAGTIALHPGCKPGWPWKKWHGFAELAAHFPHVVIVGTQADLNNAGTYFGHGFTWPKHVRNFAGSLDLADTAALIGQCTALVSNDSGLMHLAVALGVPTFGIFGITSPAREGVRSPHFHPLTKALDCEPACRSQSWGRRDCAHKLDCLKSLRPADVAEMVSAGLDSPMPPPPAVSDGPISAGPVSTGIITERSMSDLRLNYYANIFDVSGFGHAARSYVHALHHAGVAVSVVNLGGPATHGGDALVNALVGKDVQADFHLFHGVPPAWSRQAFALPSRDVIAMTAWETDTMPSTWRPILSHAADVWLPCRFNVDVFGRALGRQPFLLPHVFADITKAAPGFAVPGLAADDWLCYSIFAWQERKDPEGMLEAFLRAFPAENKAVLLLKAEPSAAGAAHAALAQARQKTGSQARVILCCELWDDGRIAALHQRGDCYLSLHKGEGWGYPLFEAACRGNPVVAPHFSGPADFLDAQAHPPVRYYPAAVTQRYIHYSRKMKWAQADLVHAAEMLRQTFAQGPQAKDRARAAAIRLNQTYSLQQIGQSAHARLLQLKEKKGRPRPGLAANPVLAHFTNGRTGPSAPTAPIAGSWYDADYFDRGRTSNWSRGYHWRDMAAIFTDAATYLSAFVPPQASIMDAGCAKGFLVRAMRQQGLQAWGFDHSPWAIDHAESEAKPYLRQASTDDVVFDRPIDLLCAMSLLESLTEAQLRAFLTRAASHASTLFAIINTPTADAPPNRLSRGDRDLSRVSLQPPPWWEALLDQCGWSVDPRQEECRAHPVAVKMGWNVHLRTSR